MSLSSSYTCWKWNCLHTQHNKQIDEVCHKCTNSSKGALLANRSRNGFSTSLIMSPSVTTVVSSISKNSLRALSFTWKQILNINQLSCTKKAKFIPSVSTITLKISKNTIKYRASANSNFEDNCEKIGVGCMWGHQFYAWCFRCSKISGVGA